MELKKENAVRDAGQELFWLIIKEGVIAADVIILLSILQLPVKKSDIVVNVLS